MARTVLTREKQLAGARSNVEVIGSAEVGDTLVWGRQPGIMQENVVVDAGRTYYIHYTTGIGLRWELTDVQ